jgi:hypothetical protein
VDSEKTCAAKLAELRRRSASLQRLKSRASKLALEALDDDVRSWIVIGLISCSVALTVLGPLLWASLHKAL